MLLQLLCLCVSHACLRLTLISPCMRVYRAVSIECCYQNVGIATSLALTMFEGDELAEALGVPFYYGLTEAVILGVYCLGAWKVGWTKAPKTASIWTILSTSYEIVDTKDDKAQPLNQELSERTKETADNNNDEEGDDDFQYVEHSDAVEMGEA